ncbi:MAG: hypothetical protein KDC54_09260 [Lewinella sp.]|nr:hypothetical protein [Lewinella sp.]
MTILTVVIGLVFVLLLLSLLATTIMELLASFFHLRGRNLIKGLRNMLATNDESEQILERFKDNSLYKHLTQQYGRQTQGPPSYMGAETFRSILFDIILEGEEVDKLKEKIDTLPDEDLRNVLNQLLRDADHELDQFKAKVEKWFNDVMDRASGWYKRYTQKILVGVGLVIALVFNADTFAIYVRLESDPQTLQQVVQMAEEFVSAQGEVMVRPADPELETSLNNIRELIDQRINYMRSPLGLGWDDVDFSSYGVYDWLAKIMGYIVTALAVSLGAPFWFDLLRKIVNIRAAGNESS